MRPPAVNRIAQQRPSRTWEWQWSRVLRELIWMLVRASTLLLEQLKCLPASLQCLGVTAFRLVVMPLHHRALAQQFPERFPSPQRSLRVIDTALTEDLPSLQRR